MTLNNDISTPVLFSSKDMEEMIVILPLVPAIIPPPTLAKGLIISVNSLLPWSLKRPLSNNLGMYLPVGESIAKVEDFITDLQEYDYKVILTYCSTIYENETKAIGKNLGVDGVAQNPRYSKQGTFASLARDFNISPSMSMYVAAGKPTCAGVEQESLLACFVKSGEVINSMLTESTVAMTDRAINSTLSRVKVFMMNHQPELRKIFSQYKADGG